RMRTHHHSFPTRRSSDLEEAGINIDFRHGSCTFNSNFLWNSIAPSRKNIKKKRKNTLTNRKGYAKIIRVSERYGEMSERFKELVLKTSDTAMCRGFESHSLRQFLSRRETFDLEWYPRGRRGSPAKGVGV